MKGKNGTSIVELLPELNAGVFESQINRALSDIALNVVTHGKKGALTIKLELTQIGESNQVAVTHSIRSETPKPRGRVIEEIAQDTPMHVGAGGTITLYPSEKQSMLELGAGAATGARE